MNYWRLKSFLSKECVQLSIRSKNILTLSKKLDDSFTVVYKVYFHYPACIKFSTFINIILTIFRSKWKAHNSRFWILICTQNSFKVQISILYLFYRIGRSKIVWYSRMNCKKLCPGKFRFVLFSLSWRPWKRIKGIEGMFLVIQWNTIHSRAPAEKVRQSAKMRIRGDITNLAWGNFTLYRVEIFRSEKACSFPFTIASPHRSYGAVFFRHLIQQLG